MEYDENIALEICEAISTRSDGLEKMCRENAHWPKVTTIYKWIFTNDTFAKNYAKAKEFQQEVLVSEMLQICNNRENDTILDADGKTRSNMAAVQRDRLIADTIKWTASRLVRKYSDKSTVDTNITVNHEDSIKALE